MPEVTFCTWQEMREVGEEGGGRVIETDILCLLGHLWGEGESLVRDQAREWLRETLHVSMVLVNIFPFYGIEGLLPGNLPGISTVQETVCLWGEGQTQN